MFERGIEDLHSDLLDLAQDLVLGQVNFRQAIGVSSSPLPVQPYLSPRQAIQVNILHATQGTQIGGGNHDLTSGKKETDINDQPKE